MITNEDLKAAIAECEGTKNPNANTCVKLAAFYTILNQRQERSMPMQTAENYAFADGPDYSSDSEFGRIMAEKGIEKCLPIIDELMQTLYVLNPKLYNGVIRKLNDV